MAYTTINKPSQYFGINAYAGQGGSRNITDVTNVEFTPDFVWVKHRQDASTNHALFDVLRGVGKFLESNTTTAEQTESQSITAFVNGGFSVGTQPNTPRTDESGGTPNHVAWQWKANGAGVANTAGTISSTVSANTTSGFSIVSYTGTGANATVGHGLGAAPKMIIVKNRSVGGTDWRVGHQSLTWNNEIFLDLTNATNASSGAWNNTAPTSSVFSLGSGNYGNGSGNSIIAYCFAEVKGFSKFSSYTGNSSTNGTFVYTGFKPAFVMLKVSNLAGENWVLMDNKRNTYNVVNGRLFPNLSNAESTAANILDFTSNGFKLRNADSSVNTGYTYIYMAFAENPFVTSTQIPTTAR